MIKFKNFSDVLRYQDFLEFRDMKNRKGKFTAKDKNYRNFRGNLIKAYIKFSEETVPLVKGEVLDEDLAERITRTYTDVLLAIAAEINYLGLKNQACEIWDLCWEYCIVERNGNTLYDNLNAIMECICTEKSVLKVLRKYILLSKIFGLEENDILQNFRGRWQYVKVKM